MKRTRFCVANWKMYWTVDQTLQFAAKNYDQIINLTVPRDATVVLCPSFTALYSLSNMFKDTPVLIGAQDCSEHHVGAFTGVVSASDIVAAGARFCIVGHSDRRKFNSENDQMVASKCQQLVDAGACPILCVGETKEDFDAGQTLAILVRQLDPVMQLIASRAIHIENKQIVIAYEPVWAIGSGQVPEMGHLETVFAWLESYFEKHAPALGVHLLYGGSVSSGSVRTLTKLKLIDGFLVGGASLDFQEFENIVKCTMSV